jgi:hypothetical protein
VATARIPLPTHRHHSPDKHDARGAMPKDGKASVKELQAVMMPTYLVVCGGYACR